MTRCTKLIVSFNSWWAEFIFKDFSWWTEGSLSLIYFILVFCCFDTVQTPWLNIKNLSTMSSINYFFNNILLCMFSWDVECKLIFLPQGQRVVSSFRTFFSFLKKVFHSTRIGLRTDRSWSISTRSLWLSLWSFLTIFCSFLFCLMLSFLIQCPL